MWLYSTILKMCSILKMIHKPEEIYHMEITISEKIFVLLMLKKWSDISVTLYVQILTFSVFLSAIKLWIKFLMNSSIHFINDAPDVLLWRTRGMTDYIKWKLRTNINNLTFNRMKAYNYINISKKESFFNIIRKTLGSGRDKSVGVYWIWARPDHNGHLIIPEEWFFISFIQLEINIGKSRCKKLSVKSIKLSTMNILVNAER